VNLRPSWSVLMNTNLYKILGVSKHATNEQIKKAFRQKALKCHPDKTGRLPDAEKKLAEEEFKKINNAYEVLVDPNKRQQYDNSTSSNAFLAENTDPYEYGREEFDSDNGRLKLKGASKTETETDFKNNKLIVKFTFKLEKNSLDPMWERLNELVDALHNKAYTLDKDNNTLVLTNKKYEVISDKMTAMYYTIMSHVDLLSGNPIDYSEMLSALEKSQAIIMEALEEGECAKHRGFVRNCPILRELCVCLDLIINFFAFLIQKITKIVSGDKTNVFANGQAFMCGMFKPIPTSTRRQLDELNTDMTWCIREIKEEAASGQLRFYSLS
jgi:hypothetical protein